MATINYNFTLANTTGTQSIELIDCDTNSVLTTTSGTNPNGSVSGTLTATLVSGQTVKVKVTDGSTVQETTCRATTCSTLYNLKSTSYTSKALACQDYVMDLTLYASENTETSITKFYTDSQLTSPWSGFGFYRFYNPINLVVFVTEYNASGVVGTITEC